jgi:hypothetical protein
MIGVSLELRHFWLNYSLHLYSSLENQLDSDNEKEEKKATANKFDDEDQVDPEEVAKKKKEE